VLAQQQQRRRRQGLALSDSARCLYLSFALEKIDSASALRGRDAAFARWRTASFLR
jgi:hypothetical protein